MVVIIGVSALLVIYNNRYDIKIIMIMIMIIIIIIIIIVIIILSWWHIYFDVEGMCYFARSVFFLTWTKLFLMPRCAFIYEVMESIILTGLKKYSHILISRDSPVKVRLIENNSNKTRVLLCKRLSGQCRDVSVVVYFHRYWWWWAKVDWTGLY